MDWLKLSPKEKQEMMTSIEDMVLERVRNALKIRCSIYSDRTKE
jgi:predicted Fe-S protein YdhL (DUF1289 family)